MKTLLSLLSLFTIAFTNRAAHADDSACSAIEDCVTRDLLTVELQCRAGNPCASNYDSFAVSTTDLAYRAIAMRHCDSKHFETLRGCNQCYTLAARVLKSRLDAPLFHGMMALAASQIDRIKSQKCGNLLDTDYLSMSGNLDSRSAIVTLSSPASRADWDRESSFTVDSAITDGLGEAHNLKTYLFHSEERAWIIEMTVDGGEIVGGTPGELGLIAGQFMLFQEDGQRMTAPSYPSLPGDILIAPSWTNGAPVHYVPVLFQFTSLPSSSGVVVNASSQR